MSKDKDGEDGESIITQLESITNQNQSICVAEGQPSHVNKGDQTNMSVRSKSKSRRSGASSVSSARKAAILAKKLEAEKASLRLKMMEEETIQRKEEEIELQALREKQRLQEEQQRRVQEDLERAQIQAEYRNKWRELRQKAQESQLEYEHALKEDECMCEEENASRRDELAELLGSETLEDRVKRLGEDKPTNVEQDILVSNSQQPPDRHNILQTAQLGASLSDQGHTSQVRDIVGASKTVHNPGHGDSHTVENTESNPLQPSVQQRAPLTEQLLERMLPTLIKMERPKLPGFDGNPVDYARFKACVKVEIERKGVYDNVEKLNFLLDAVTGSAKSCLKRFIPGSERYDEAWEALDNRFGQPDVVVAAAKKQIDEFPDILSENAGKIREYQELVSELVGVYKELRFEHELKAQLPESYVKRLPTRLCARWGERVEGKPELSTWEEFASWLEKEARLCEGKQRWMPEKRERKKSSWQSGNVKDTKGERPKLGMFAGAANESPDKPRTGRKCPIHELSNHALQDCRKFTSMPVDEKEKVILRNRLCLSCLHPGHKLSQCQVNAKCQVEGCGMRHHTSVHEVDKRFIERSKTKKRERERVPSPPAVPPANEQTVSMMGFYSKGQALVEVLPVVFYGKDGKKETVMVLRDNGCNTTLMDDDLAVALGLEGREISLELQGINSQRVVSSKHISKCQIARIGKEDKKLWLRDIKTINGLNGPDQRLRWSELKKEFPHLRDLDIHDTDTKRVQVIVGTNNSDLILPRKIVKPRQVSDQVRHPYAVESRLGWAVTNWLPGRKVSQYTAMKVYHREVDVNDDLKRLVLAQSAVDAIGVVKVANPVRSIEDKRAMEIMERSTRKMAAEGAYESGLLWRDKEPSLPDNYEMVLQRLNSLNKKFKSRPEMRERYSKSIKEDIEKGFVKKLTKEEIKQTSDVTWYLPHRYVINPKKPQRLRRVYDASAKYQGQSLNDKIYTGPDLLSSLFGVLLRFCEGQIAMAADVKEMYHMLRLPDRDKPALRFLWNEEEDAQEPGVYQFERTVFGEVSAPSRANYVMRRNAEENGADLPLGVRAVKRHFYMDDGLPSTNSRQEAVEMREQMSELLRRGGFYLHKWLTNDPEVLATIPTDERSPRFLELTDGKLPTDRALGVIWDAEEDVLKFSGPADTPGKTKRQILSQSFSIWDPRGLILPFSIRAKMFLQKLHCKKVGWDDKIEDGELREWLTWCEEAKELTSIDTPRAFIRDPSVVTRSEIHVFCDASQESYGACAYLRCVLEDGSADCRLIAGKGRVAPLKSHSICRLELMGALIGARLVETVINELTIEINAVVFWCDSTTVLHWINQIISSYKAFVGNRISEIHSIVQELETKLGAEMVTWRYVPTEVNPADDITRGLSPSKLVSGQRYQNGPEFLKWKREYWPENKINSPECDPEERKETKWTGVFQETTPLISWSRFSCLAKLRRVMAYVLHFVGNSRRKKSGCLGTSRLTSSKRHRITL